MAVGFFFVQVVLGIAFFNQTVVTKLEQILYGKEAEESLVGALCSFFGPFGERESEGLLIVWKVQNKCLHPLLCIIYWKVLDFI